MWNREGKIWYSEEEYNKVLRPITVITEGTYTTLDGTEYKLGKNLKVEKNDIIGLIDNTRPAYYIEINGSNAYVVKVTSEIIDGFCKLIASVEYIIKGDKED